MDSEVENPIWRKGNLFVGIEIESDAASRCSSQGSRRWIQWQHVMVGFRMKYQYVEDRKRGTRGCAVGVQVTMSSPV